VEDSEVTGDVCHDHAARWVALHPGHTVVRGFLVMVVGQIYNKHSVIDTGRRLLDITPRPDKESQRLLNFVEFDGGSPTIFEGLPNQVQWTPEMTGR
jgi:hypothetical protein